MGLFIPFEAAEHYFSADWEKSVYICTYVITKKCVQGDKEESTKDKLNSK